MTLAREDFTAARLRSTSCPRRSPPVAGIQLLPWNQR